MSTTPTPSGAEVAGDVARAIRDMEHYRQSHVGWAAYFEAHPDIAAQYVATGEWDDADEHRRIVAAYDNVLAILRRRPATPAVPAFRGEVIDPAAASRPSMFAFDDLQDPPEEEDDASAASSFACPTCSAPYRGPGSGSGCANTSCLMAAGFVVATPAAPEGAGEVERPHSDECNRGGDCARCDGIRTLPGGTVCDANGVIPADIIATIRECPETARGESMILDVLTSHERLRAALSAPRAPEAEDTARWEEIERAASLHDDGIKGPWADEGRRHADLMWLVHAYARLRDPVAARAGEDRARRTHGGAPMTRRPGLLCWDKPAKARTTAEHHAIYQSDTNVAGTYVPNMSDEDAEKWRAKLIGGSDPRVEIRKLMKPWTQIVLVVRADSVRLSMNGPADISNAQFHEITAAVEEARAALEDR